MLFRSSYLARSHTLSTQPTWDPLLLMPVQFLFSSALALVPSLPTTMLSLMIGLPPLLQVSTTYLTLSLPHDIDSLVILLSSMTMKTLVSLIQQKIPLQCLQRGRLKSLIPWMTTIHPPLFLSHRLLSRRLFLLLTPLQCLQ